MPAVIVVVLAMSIPSTAEPRGASFARSGLRGSGPATLQLVTVPARPGFVAATPGRREVWAVGHVAAHVPGWDAADPNGQIVFMRLAADGWRVIGPPLDRNGRIFNPTLFSFSLRTNGEGWAVGDQGILLRRAPGSDAWIESAQSRSLTHEELTGVSLSPTGSAGFAVGEHSTILRLQGTSWVSESGGTDMAQKPDLTAVSALRDGSAWAVSGSTSADLLVFHRTGGAWRRVLTNQAIFDGPHPANSRGAGTAVSSAFGASLAATPDGVWIGGQIIPQDASQPFGDQKTGESSRPFVARVLNSGATTSYCPDSYGVRQRAGQVDVDQSAICDRPFPSSLFDITSLSVMPGNEVFAAGLGLFHFKNGGWFREPNANGYLISMAMLSPREGWFATTGNTYGAGGAIHSEENVVGHYTENPAMSHSARWPLPLESPLESVAIAPDQSGRVLAVGVEGWSALYAPGQGWDRGSRSSVLSIHSVAWRSAREAWAVGEHGLIQRFDGRDWTALEPVNTQSLFALAFRSPSDGIAVGASGTVLHFDGTSWSLDRVVRRVTEENLYAVVATPDGYLAAGANGTLIELNGSRWAKHPEGVTLLESSGVGSETVYALATAPDGSVYAGGTGGSLLVGLPGAKFKVFASPLQGTILALSAIRDGRGGVRLLASVSADPAKYRGDRIAATRSVLMMHERGVWRDLSGTRKRTLYPSLAPGAFEDPILSLAPDSASAGWGVGGIPAQTPDGEDQHLRALATGAVYRFDTIGDPRFTAGEADVELPKTGFNFAVFSETWCEKPLCSAAVGSGSQADLVALQIQNEISRAWTLPHGPRFAMFAGNDRAAGLPEELLQFRNYLDRFPIPVFGAIGDRDLVNSINSSAVQDALASARLPTGNNDFWKSVFGDRAKPWGDGPQRAGFLPATIPGSVAADAGLARTHYVFDYAPNGKRLLRVVVLDSSTRSYGKSTDQNPSEPQADWLGRVLVDAKGLSPDDAIPTVIVMNQPTVLPDKTQLPNWVAPQDKSAFEDTVVANFVSGVFAGGARMNIRGGFPDADVATVPLYVLGGGGGPLGFEPPSPTAFPTKLPSDGFYNAWFLVNVGQRRVLPTGHAVSTLTVTPFPILESLAIHSRDGRTAAGGNTLRFSGLARGLPGGAADPDQSKTTYYEFGSGSLASCGRHGPGVGGCLSDDALIPPYRFYSEDPAIADFVKPNFGVGSEAPLYDAKGNPVRDPQGTDGLLCTFKAGTAHINVVSGFKRARIAVNVGAGYGPCVKAPVLAPHVVNRVPRVETRPVPRVPEERTFFRGRIDSIGVIIPPPPAPVVAPAPPGAPGVGRKEEHEVQYEKEGDSEKGHHAFVAVSRRKPDPVQDPWMLLGGVALLGFFAAVAAAGARQRSVEAARMTSSGRRS